MIDHDTKTKIFEMKRLANHMADGLPISSDRIVHLFARLESAMIQSLALGFSADMVNISAPQPVARFEPTDEPYNPSCVLPDELEPELMDSCGDRATETGVALIDLRNEIRHARTLHTHPSFAALVEEIGEVATDIQNGKCTRAELIQVAAVAIRLATEPWGGE